MSNRLERSAFLEVVRNSPLVSVDLIVRDEQGAVLVGLRNNRPAKDWWFVPGGRICKDERIAAAIERVAHEELGLETAAADARLIGVHEHLYDDNVGEVPGFGTHYVVLAHELRVERARVRPDPAQHRQYRWLTPAQLVAAPDVHPNTKAYF